MSHYSKIEKDFYLSCENIKDLKKGSDQMPGYFDFGGEYLLLPMFFDEFFEARSESGPSKKFPTKKTQFPSA